MFSTMALMDKNTNKENGSIGEEGLSSIGNLTVINTVNGYLPSSIPN